MKMLFTTDDGVDIYEGEKYFSVNIESYKSRFSDSVIPAFQIVGPYHNPKAAIKDSGIIKYFSTKESARNWINENMWQKIK